MEERRNASECNCNSKNKCKYEYIKYKISLFACKYLKTKKEEARVEGYLVNHKTVTGGAKQSQSGAARAKIGNYQTRLIHEVKWKLMKQM